MILGQVEITTKDHKLVTFRAVEPMLGTGLLSNINVDSFEVGKKYQLALLAENADTHEEAQAAANADN